MSTPPQDIVWTAWLSSLWLVSLAVLTVAFIGLAARTVRGRKHLANTSSTRRGSLAKDLGLLAWPSLLVGLVSLMEIFWYGLDSGNPPWVVDALLGWVAAVSMPLGLILGVAALIAQW